MANNNLIKIGPNGIPDLRQITIDPNAVPDFTNTPAPQIGMQRNIPTEASALPESESKRTVPMFSPDGALGDIPSDQVESATQAGGMIASAIISPDGQPGHVPANRLHDALKAGAKIDDSGMTQKEYKLNHPSVGQRILNTVSGPGTIGEDFVDHWRNPREVDATDPMVVHNELSKAIIQPQNVMTPEEQKNNPEISNTLGLAGSLSSPENLAIMYASGGLGKMPGPAGEIIGKAVSAGWSFLQIHQALQTSPEFLDAVARGDELEARNALSKMVLSAAVAIPGIEHVIGKEGHIPGGQVINAGVDSLANSNFDKKIGGAIANTAGAAVDKVGQAAGSAVQGVKKGLGLGDEFYDLLRKGSPPSKNTAYDYDQALHKAEPQLRQVMIENPKIETPEELVKVLDKHITEMDARLGAQAFQFRGTPEGRMSGIESKVRQELNRAFDENPGKYKSEQRNKAISDVMQHLLQEEPGQLEGTTALREPDIAEAEGVRQAFKQDTDTSFGKQVPPAEAFAKQTALKVLRDLIDQKFDQLGVKNVKEWRQQEAPLIDVRDQYEKAVNKSKEMGNYNVFESLTKQLGWKTLLGFSSGVAAHGDVMTGLAGVAGANILGAIADKIRYQKFSPDVKIRKAVQKAINEGPSHAALPEFGSPNSPGVSNPSVATGGPGLGSEQDLEARYELPQDKAIDVPTERRPSGTFPRDVHHHEWGHITNAGLEDFGTAGIKSHLHPDAGPGTAAAARIVFNGIEKDASGMMTPESIMRNSGRILSTVMGGAAANDLFGGIPVELNTGLKSDLSLIRGTLKSLGLTDVEVESGVRYGLDRAKRNLTQPGISDILQSNSAVRETGLSPEWHASPERTEAYAKEIRRIRDENRTRSAGDRTTGNRTGAIEAVGGLGQENVPGRQGEAARTNQEGDLAANRDEIDKYQKMIEDAGLVYKGKIEGPTPETSVHNFEDPAHPDVTMAMRQDKMTPEALKARAENKPAENAIRPEPLHDAKYSLDKISKHFGVSSDASKTGEGASLILPDGKFVHLNQSDHPAAINTIGKYTPENYSADDRVPFINESGAIRSNFTTGKAGRTLSFSVPKGGVLPEQIDAMKAAVKEGLGTRNGQLRIETADSPTVLRNSIKDFATANDVEPMLREIGAHPEQNGKDLAISKSPNLDAYHAEKDLPPVDTTKVSISKEQGGRIADAYDEMTHDPDNPKVKAAYGALKAETKQQWKQLQKQGMTMSVVDTDPYANAQEMLQDINQNHHISVWSGEGDMPSDHPLREIDPDTGVSYNTLFRAVHDVAGHGVGLNDFSESGEENAYNLHRQSYSPAAVPALVTETKGQANWFFNNKKVREGGGEPNAFPRQKAGILPEEFHRGENVSKQNVPEEKIEISDLAKKAAKDNKKEGGFTADLRSGKVNDTGYIFEIMPEKRQILDHEVTPRDIQKFYNENRELFQKHPELRVGGYENNLEVSAHTDNLDIAKTIARRLDQKSILQVVGKKIIPLSGKGVRQDFANFPLEDRLSELRGQKNLGGNEPLAGPDKQNTNNSGGRIVENMADPDTRYKAARHEAGHAVISELLNPNSVRSIELGEFGGRTWTNAPNNKQTINSLNPDELKTMIATSLAGGLNEYGGTTIRGSSGDVAKRARLMGTPASNPIDDMARLLTGKTAGKDQMIEGNKTLAESRARVQALLADPKTIKKIDRLTEVLSALGSLTGDQVREFLQKQ